MSTLVTGGTGLVGSAVDADIKLSSKDGNLISLEDTLNIFSTTFSVTVIMLLFNLIVHLPLMLLKAKKLKEMQ